MPCHEKYVWHLITNHRSQMLWIIGATRANWKIRGSLKYLSSCFVFCDQCEWYRCSDQVAETQMWKVERGPSALSRKLDSSYECGKESNENSAKSIAHSRQGDAKWNNFSFGFRSFKATNFPSSVLRASAWGENFKDRSQLPSLPSLTWCRIMQALHLWKMC